MGLGVHNIWGRVNAGRTAGQVAGLEPVPAVSITTASGLRVHGIQTGWIAIKSAHYKMGAVESLRLPAILADPHWTTAKPIISWVIEHPEGLIVVDSGERAAANNLETYLACAEPGNRFFITRCFRVQVEPESELGPQIQKLGLSPSEVRWVVQTHLHFDHANGFDFFPRAQVLISRAEYQGHQQIPAGAVQCLWPRDFSPTALDYQARPFATFPQHHQLTNAGDVVIVPTLGHSYGHQSVVLIDGNKSYFFAGDVSFDEGQLKRLELAGIVHNVPQSWESLELTRRFVASQPTIYLPTHDPKSLQRFAKGQITQL